MVVKYLTPVLPQMVMVWTDVFGEQKRQLNQKRKRWEDTEQSEAELCQAQGLGLIEKTGA